MFIQIRSRTHARLANNLQCFALHVHHNASVCLCIFHTSHHQGMREAGIHRKSCKADLSQGMGYTAGVANLLSAPPVVFAVIVAFSFAWLADHYHLRAPIIAAQATISLIGLMLTAYHRNNGVRYFGIFLGQAGCQGNIPAILAYQSNNIRLQSKRSVGSALQIGFGAIGGILASTSFREKDAPRYVNGLWATAGLQLFILTACAFTTLFFYLRNRQLDRGTLKKPIEGQEGFKYTY